MKNEQSDTVWIIFLTSLRQQEQSTNVDVRNKVKSSV